MPMIIDGTNGAFFASWTTATRPASPVAGQMGYNTSLNAFEGYNGSAWSPVGGVTSITAGTGISSTGGTTPTIANTGVTSLTAGTGISLSGSTGAVTISAIGGTAVTSVSGGNGISSSGGTTPSITVACPGFNTVGSYVQGGMTVQSGGGPNTGPASGSNYSAGGADFQIRSAAPYNDFDGGAFGVWLTNNLSGTWKWMGAPAQTRAGNPISAVCCRVS